MSNHRVLAVLYTIVSIGRWNIPISITRQLRPGPPPDLPLFLSSPYDTGGTIGPPLRLPPAIVFNYKSRSTGVTPMRPSGKPGKSNDERDSCAAGADLHKNCQQVMQPLQTFRLYAPPNLR